jgi:hypothetical protein
MITELIITGLIVGIAAYILFKNIKKKSKLGCDCDCCSSHCSKYQKHNV